MTDAFGKQNSIGIYLNMCMSIQTSIDFNMFAAAENILTTAKTTSILENIGIKTDTNVVAYIEHIEYSENLEIDLEYIINRQFLFRN